MAETKPLDRLSADATNTGKPVFVAIGGATVEVLPPRKWKASGLRALRESDFDAWAEKCLAPGGYAIWQSVDPDLDQCEKFFVDWQAAIGESLPE